MKHDSLPAERFAQRAHNIWAILSLFSSLLSGAACIQVWNLVYLPGILGWYFFGVVCTLIALVLMGVGGVLWHLWGARDHQNNIDNILVGRANGKRR